MIPSTTLLVGDWEAWVLAVDQVQLAAVLANVLWVMKCRRSKFFDMVWLLGDGMLGGACQTPAQFIASLFEC